ALQDSSASNARHCVENFAVLRVAWRASARVCSCPQAARGDRRRVAGQAIQLAYEVAAALVRQRRTKRKPTEQGLIYKVGFSSHMVFSSQAINSSRSATTS